MISEEKTREVIFDWFLADVSSANLNPWSAPTRTRVTDEAGMEGEREGQEGGMEKGMEAPRWECPQRAKRDGAWS